MDANKEMSDLLKLYNMLENFSYEVEKSLNSESVKPYIRQLNKIFEEVGEKTSLSNRTI